MVDLDSHAECSIPPPLQPLWIALCLGRLLQGTPGDRREATTRSEVQSLPECDLEFHPEPCRLGQNRALGHYHYGDVEGGPTMRRCGDVWSWVSDLPSGIRGVLLGITLVFVGIVVYPIAWGLFFLSGLC